MQVVRAALQHVFLQLCHDGGAPCVNAVDALGVPVFVRLLNASRRWLTGSSAVPPCGQFAARTFIQFLVRTLQHFLRHGLDPNASLAMLRTRRGVGGRAVVASSYYREVISFVFIHRNGKKNNTKLLQKTKKDIKA